ncbi:MAG: hypothetical protein RIC52_17405, partial [Amphiplicatus sp.]
IAEKQKKGRVSTASDEELARPDNVIDLMEALKKSVAKNKTRSKRTKTTKRTKKTASARKKKAAKRA